MMCLTTMKKDVEGWPAPKAAQLLEGIAIVGQIEQERTPKGWALSKILFRTVQRRSDTDVAVRHRQDDHLGWAVGLLSMQFRSALVAAHAAAAPLVNLDAPLDLAVIRALASCQEELI